MKTKKLQKMFTIKTKQSIIPNRCNESEEQLSKFFKESSWLGGNEQKQIMKVAEEHDF